MNYHAPLYDYLNKFKGNDKQVWIESGFLHKENGPAIICTGERNYDIWYKKKIKYIEKSVLL